MAALDKMRAAGFEVAIAPNDGGLLVRPAERLNDGQRQWLKANRAALLAALASEQPAPRPVAAPVRCIDCAHSSRADQYDELGAWRLCSAGNGGRFAYQEHYCTAWEPTAAKG